MLERSTVIEPYRRINRHLIHIPRSSKKVRYIHIPAELCNWETLGALTALFLLSRLHLLGELAPFGLAFWVVASRGETKRMTLYGMVAVFAAATVGDQTYVLSLLLSMMLFFLISDKLAVRLPIPLITGMSLFIGSLSRLWFGYFHTYDLILLGFEVVLAILSVIVFAQVFRESFSNLFPERSIEGITSWVVLAGLILLSLVQGGSFLPLVAGGIARVLVLWASFLFGPGLAAATGVLLGFLLGVQGGGMIWLSILTFAGFLSGLFRPYGRVAISLGFLMGVTAISLYLAGWQAIPVEFTVTGGAIIFFLMGPVLPQRVQALAPFLKRRSADEGKRVRDLTAVRIKDYALVFKELADAFQQAGTVEEEKEKPLTALIESLAERVCKFCPSRRRCWEKDLQRTYNAMLRVLTDLENGQHIKEIRSPEFFQKYCRKKEEFLKTLSFLKEMNDLNAMWENRVADGRELVSLQLSGLSQIMFELAKEVRTGIPETRRRIKNQCFHVEIGVAQAAKGNEEICGDYYSYLELRDGKQAFILSDGMGNGNKAYQESRATVQLVEQLLLAGFRREAIIRTVNTILQLRSREESFATLDVLLVDVENGESEFLKIGAAPSYLRCNDIVREIRTPSIPLGILQEVELKQVSINLEDDTLIVLVTDGIFDVEPGQPDWLRNYIVEKSLIHPQVMADEIIHQARVLNGEPELRDDITVLVCRVKRLTRKIRDYVSDCR